MIASPTSVAVDIVDVVTPVKEDVTPDSPESTDETPDRAESPDARDDTPDEAESPDGFLDELAELPLLLLLRRRDFCREKPAERGVAILLGEELRVGW